MKLISKILTIIAASPVIFAANISNAGESNQVKQKDEGVATLDQLLVKVKSGWKDEQSDLDERKKRFLGAKEQKAGMLKESRKTLESEMKRSERLEKKFDENKIKTTDLEKTLRQRLGTMDELFGVIRQVSGDTRSHLQSSLVGAQYPGREESLEKLAKSKSLPSIEELQNLWYMLQQEMTESGKIVRFSSPIVTAEGKEEEREVIRVGTFNAISQGKFLVWNSEQRKLVELPKQPTGNHLRTAANLESSENDIVNFSIDPSRGAVLEVVVQTPDFWERIHFGGLIGYVVVGLGLVTFLIAIFRFVYLSVVTVRVRKQRNAKDVRSTNPLGRIIGVYQKNPSEKLETLELKLDESILRETSKLDRALWVIKIGAVVAPLLGLLGTVTGMIRTFQAITLFGTGDPKLMAGGISEALVTTMLGLIVAIPLVFLHSGLKSMSKRIVEILEEQSAGIIAKRAEQAV